MAARAMKKRKAKIETPLPDDVGEEEARQPESTPQKKKMKSLNGKHAVSEAAAARVPRTEKQAQKLAKKKAVAVNGTAAEEQSVVKLAKTKGKTGVVDGGRDDGGRDQKGKSGSKGAGKANEGKARIEINNDLRLFIKGIPWTIDEDALRKDFQECGEITNLKLLLDGEGQSRGMAFVTYSDEAGVNAALEYDGSDYGGQRVSVKKAAAKGSGKAEELGPKPAGCNSVVVKKLSPEVTSDDLREAFKNCGDGPLQIGLLTDKNGQSRCTARIDFHGESDVDEAIKLLGTPLKGRPLVINYCQPKTY